MARNDTENPNDRPMVMHHKGNWYYRASVAGVCSRALVAARLGYQPLPVPVWVEKAAQQGHSIESCYKQKVRQNGGEVILEQFSICKKIPGVNAYVTGHIDGVERTPDGKHYLLEVKSMSENQFMKWLLFDFQEFPVYLYQISVYSYMMRLPIKYVVIPRKSYSSNLDSFGMMNDLNNLNDQTGTRYYTYNDLVLKGGGIDKVFEKIRFAEECARSKFLPDCDTDYPYCKFSYLCNREV